MADKILCDKQDLIDIADSVRAKTNTTKEFYVSELSAAIDGITGMSGVTERDSDDLVVSEDTITVPSGYYPNEASKTILPAILKEPKITCDSDGKVTATSSAFASGYLSQKASRAGTLQLPTVGPIAVTPASKSQILAKPGDGFVTSYIQVNAVPVDNQTNTITFTGNIIKRPVEGKFYDSVVIKNPDNLVPENIKAGEVIGGVAGTLSADKEVWVLNSTITTFPASETFWDIQFVVNNVSYTRIGYSNALGLYYGDANNQYGVTTDTTAPTVLHNKKYRKLIFLESPPATLQSWLQENGVKQAKDVAIEQERAVTYESSGTYTIEPSLDIYDGMKSVAVTVVGADSSSDFESRCRRGEVNLLPNGCGIEVYSTVSNGSMVDGTYADWLSVLVFPDDVKQKLDDAVTALENNYYTYQSVFGSDYYMFMDGMRGMAGASELNYPATWSAMKSIIYNLIPDKDMYTLPQEAYLLNYSGEQYQIVYGNKATLPYIFYPAKKNGQIPKGLKINNPTGTMPTYETIFKKYGGDSGVAFVNAYPTYGINYSFIYLWMGTLNCVYSYGAQTISKEVASQMTGMTWNYDIGLSEGWNYGEYNSSNWSTATLEELQGMQDRLGLYFSQEEVQYSQMSEYEKSVFHPVYKDFYKRDGYHFFAIILNVLCEEPTST